MFKLNRIAIMLTLVGTSAFAAEGFYVAGDVGYSDANNMPSEQNFGTVSTSLDEENTSFRIAVGYSKDLKPRFGLGGELGYNDYGSDEYKATAGGYSSSNSLKYSFSSVDLLAKATFHMTKRWDLYGKLGIANEDVFTSGNDNLSDNHKVLPEAGLGVSYFATQKLSIDLSAYQTFGDDIEFDTDNDNNLPSITTANFGVSYYF